jgi:hypothetical protein
MNNLFKILNMAQKMDEYGLYRVADRLTNIAHRVYAQYSPGYQNMNLPMETRVIPFKEMEQEYKDVAEDRFKYNPRLVPKPSEQQDPGDLKDIYGDEEEQTQQDNGTVFDLNRSKKSTGPSIFSINGEPLSGITQRMYDPKGAGYMGIEHFEFDKRDENKKGYPTYSPN